MKYSNVLKKARLVDFLLALVDAESADMYDIRHAFSYMPSEWRSKVSVQRNWSEIFSKK